MFRRLAPPSFPIFLISVVLAIVAVVSLYFRIPYIGHYINPHRFWVMTAAFAVLAFGVLFGS